MQQLSEINFHNQPISPFSPMQIIKSFCICLSEKRNRKKILRAVNVNGMKWNDVTLRYSSGARLLLCLFDGEQF
jgi:hypothetical protein